MHLPYLPSNFSYFRQYLIHVLFGLPLGRAPSTTKSIHFLIHSPSSSCTTWPLHNFKPHANCNKLHTRLNIAQVHSSQSRTCFLRTNDDEVGQLVTRLLLRPDLEMTWIIARILKQINDNHVHQLCFNFSFFHILFTGWPLSGQCELPRQFVTFPWRFAALLRGTRHL